MRKSYLVIVCVLVVTLWAAAVQASSIVTGGWNENEVYPGPITQAVDNTYQNSWAETGYVAANGTVSAGLPVSGSFLSATGSGVTYSFQSYTSLNALRMGNGDLSSGTLTVVPGEYSVLYILATSGNGNAPASATSNITLNFIGSSDTYYNALYAPDWWLGAGGSTSVALGGLQRIVVNSNTIDYSTGGTGANFQLYESILYLSPGDRDLTLQSITFNDATGGGGATSVYDVVGVPLPPSVLLLGSGLAGLAGLSWRWRRKTA